MGDRRSAIVLVLAAGCYQPTFGPGARCMDSSECPGDLQCVGNVCGGTLQVDASIDAPPPDAAPDAPPGTVTIVIGDDPSQIMDTEINLTAPNDTHGTIDHVSVDSPETSLLWFDLAGVSPSVTVLAATLTVTTDGFSADLGNGTVTVHRLREAWLENEATWNQRVSGQNWTISGAEPPSRDATTMATLRPNELNAAFSVELSTTMVQEWLAQPAMNCGIAIVRGTSMEHVHLQAKESGTTWSRLTLLVQP